MDNETINETITGDCRICGACSEDSTFKWEGLCLACSNQLEWKTKEKLLYEISQLKKQLENLTYLNKKTIDNFIHQKE